MAENTTLIIDTRKVHPVGNGGLSVVLPIGWARENGVGKGSEVLVIADESIHIEPKTEENLKRAHKSVRDSFGKKWGDINAK